LIPSVGPGADPGVQAVSPQVTVSHPPGGRLSLLSARPVVTSPAAEHHRPLAGTKLYCLVTEAHRCEQLAQCCYAAWLTVSLLNYLKRQTRMCIIALQMLIFTGIHLFKRFSFFIQTAYRNISFWHYLLTPSMMSLHADMYTVLSIEEIVLIRMHRATSD